MSLPWIKDDIEEEDYSDILWAAIPFCAGIPNGMPAPYKIPGWICFYLSSPHDGTWSGQTNITRNYLNFETIRILWESFPTKIQSVD